MGDQPVVVGRLLVGALASAALCCWSCAPTPAAPASILPWHLDAIGAADAWQVTQGQGEVIAILDSGLTDSVLPDLRAREVGPRPAPDALGHGTAVTTLAAGSGDMGVWGVAPQARVLSISVIDSSGEISPQAIVDGIHAAVGVGASVINMSFGQASDNPQVRAAIDDAIARGVLVVAAAGDTASPTPLFPANLVGEVIAVRAIAETGKPPPAANPAGANGIDAPGENLPAVRLQDGAMQVVGSDGSSMAAAVISGSVALLEACVHRNLGFTLRQATALRALRESAGTGPWINLRAALRAVGC